MNPQDLESLLQHPPRPNAPIGLKQQLEKQFRQRGAHGPVADSSLGQPASWWERWMPALGYGVAAAAIASVVIYQSNLENKTPRSADQSQTPGTETVGVASKRLADERKLNQELSALRSEKENLEEKLSRQSALQKEYDALLAEKKAATQLDPALEEARAKAQRVHCISNLKQLGTAIKIYEADHNDKLPTQFSDLYNEVPNAKIFICPSKMPDPPITTFEQLNLVGSSYVFSINDKMHGGAKQDVGNVYLYCPYHNAFSIADGHVQLVSEPEKVRKLIQHLNLNALSPSFE